MKLPKKSSALLLVFLVLFGGFTFLRFGFVSTVKADSGKKWISRFASEMVSGDVHTATFSISPQVFWDNKTSDWGELEFVKNDTYPYFITWASVANTTYFIRNSHIALEVTNVSYVKLWNPDYTSVSVYSERWAVEYWQVNKWKDTGVGAQPNSWSISQDADSINITRIQKLVGVGELNVTYIVRKGMYLKHEIVFKSLDSGGGVYRVVMQWAGIAGSKVKTDTEEFTVTGETHKVAPYFLVGENSSSMVVQEYLESVYPNLTDIIFNTHAQGIKADVILGNWTLVLNEQLVIDPETSTFSAEGSLMMGYVEKANAVYLTAQGAASGSGVTVGAGPKLGQTYTAPNFNIFRGFLRFDTSTLAGKVVSAAYLSLGGYQNGATQAFDVYLQNWTDAPDTLGVDDYGAFDGITYSESWNSDQFSLTVYNNITISNVALINVNGHTDICHRSSRDIGLNPPDLDTEYLYFDGNTDPQPPKLIVTLTAPEYQYVDSQTNVDSVADVGTHSSFVAQQATDWTNDTLTEANTNTTVLNNAENFVDSNTSNIDSHTGHGTSSNFTAQQDANVAYNDTLTEALTSGGTTSDVFTDGFEDGTFGKWDGNGATTWTDDGGICTNSSNLEGWASTSHSGTYYAGTGASGDGNLVSDNLDLSGITSFGVRFWYAVDDTDGASELVLQYWDGAAYDTIADLSGGTEDTWTYYSSIITDSQYFDSTFRIAFLAAAGANEAVYIDDLVINKTLANNYELDYEFSWTTADYDEANEYLCIRTNSYTGTAENLGVDVWDGSWKSVSNALTASAWNNISITTNLTGATIYFRFIGKTETSDTAQNTWVIECSLIHTWSVGVNYELDLEEQFTNVNYTRGNEELDILGGNGTNADQYIKSTYVDPSETVIDDMEVTTDWTYSGAAGGSISNNTVNFKEGTNALKFTSPNSSVVCSADKTGSWNFSGTHFRLWVYVDDTANLGQFTLYAAQTAWTVYIYQNIYSMLRTGWNEISWDRSNFTAVGGSADSVWQNAIRLRFRVVASSTTMVNVTIDDFNYNPDIITGGVVTIVFDDNWESTYTDGYDSMLAYGYDGVTAISPNTTQFGGTNRMNMTQLTTLNNSGWDVISHGYNHLDLTGGLSEADLIAELAYSKQWLLTQGFINGSRFIAAPYHGWNDTVIGYVSSYYDMMRCWSISLQFKETIEPNNAYRLRVFPVLNTTTVQSIEAAINETKYYNSWLILNFHILSTPTDASTEFDPANFDTILSYISSSGVAVKTFSDVYDARFAQETVRVEFRNGTQWTSIIPYLQRNSWNNVSVTLDTETFTIRFVGNIEVNDAVSSSWSKDACLLHTWDAAGADTTKPTYSGVSTNSTVRGMTWNFSVTLADETALKNYTFGCNNTGPWVNDSVVTISGTSYKANTTYTSNGTVGYVIQWEYWFADASNNLNNTGVLGNTTTGNVLTETASASITPSPTPARVSLAIRSAQGVWGFLASVSRTLAFPRSNSLNIPCNILAGRSLVIGRASSLSPLINAISSVAQALARSGSQAFTVSGLASRVQTLGRSPSLNMNFASSAVWAKVQNLAVSVSLTLTPSFSAERVAAYGRSVSAVFVSGLSAARSIVYGRSESQTLGFSASPARVLAMLRCASISPSFGLSAARAVVYGRSASPFVSVSSTVTRTITMLRTSSLAVLPSLSAVRSMVYGRTSSITAIFSESASHTDSFVRSLALAVSSTFSASRATQLGRTSLLSVSFGFSALKSFLLARTSILTVSPSASVLRAVALGRDSSLAVSLGPSAFRVLQIGRVSSFTVLTGLSAFKATLYSRVSSVSISSTFSAAKTLQLIRGSSLTLSTTMLVLRGSLLGRTSLVAITSNPFATRVVFYGRSISQLIQASPSVARLLSLSRTTVVQLLVDMVPSRIFAVSRSASISVMLNAVSGRVFAGSRVSVLSIFLSAVGVRTGGEQTTRFASVAISMSAVSSRALSSFRNPASGLTMLLSASRAFSGFRSITQNLVSDLASIRSLVLSRLTTSTSAITLSLARSLSLARANALSVNSIRLAWPWRHLERSVVQAVSGGFSASRTQVLGRTSSLSIVPILSVVRSLSFARTPSVAVLVTAASERVVSLGRSLVLLLIPSSSATRTAVLSRQASQNIAFFATVIKGGSFSFNPSLSFIVLASPDRLVSLSRASGLNVVAYLAGARSQGLSRQVNQAFYTSFQAFRNMGFARNAGQIITTFPSASRSLAMLRTGSQSILVSMQGSRSQTVARFVSQSIWESLQALRTTVFARSVGQDIVVFLSASRTSIVTRSVSLSPSEYFQALRTVAFARNADLNTMFSLSSSRSQGLSRQVSQGLSASLQALRTVGFARDISQNILVSASALRSQSLARTATQYLYWYFSANAATTFHSFFVNVALSLGVNMNPQRSTVLARAQSMLFAPTFLSSRYTGPWIVGGGVVGSAISTPMYRVTVTSFSVNVGTNIFQNKLTVDSDVVVESVSMQAGYVVLGYRLTDAAGAVLDSVNRTVLVSPSNATTVHESLGTSFFWSALGNDRMSFTLTATWQATGQVAPQTVSTSFVPCPVVAGLKEYRYYLGLGMGLLAFGVVLFHEPKKKRKA